MEEKKKPICCICGKECENEWGNNPYPLYKGEKDRCCNVCNDLHVVPARIKAWATEEKKEEK